MAYSNFKPQVWAKAIERARDELCIGVNLCNRSYEKDTGDYGKSVIINWTKRPTVKNYTIGTNIDAAETLDGSTSSTLNIDQLKYVNFLVDDVDELQSAPDIMAGCMQEAAAAIAADADKFIYNLYASAGKTITNATVNSANITGIISDAAKALYESNVPMNEELCLEVSPALYQKLWLAKVLRETPNDGSFGTGFVGMFDNFKVYMTNGIVKDEAGAYYCYARTKKAIAFIGQMRKMESYRPQGLFADAVKGLHVYGATVVRPNELITLKLTPVSEA